MTRLFPAVAMLVTAFVATGCDAFLIKDALSP